MTSRLALQTTKSAPTRHLGSTLKILASDAYLAGRMGNTARGHTPTDLTSGQKKLLDSAIRVDHAGEIAANWIYRGQLAVFKRDPVLGPLVQVRMQSLMISVSKHMRTPPQTMWDGEKKHLEVMNKLIEQHRVTPTLLTEVAKVAGFGLGVATALMGKEAAMTCTEAVETVIGEHYDE
jgi:ubiquinone biosynthesis monooxygenase Coq7